METNKINSVKDLIGNILGNVRLEYAEYDDFYDGYVSTGVYQGDSNEALIPTSDMHNEFLELNIEEIEIYVFSNSGENFVCLSKRF